ncbi:proline-rich protein 2-like [Saccopteryx leptura]|uniref:proline-rich protein 2-like n=1 Tax=Saccopteryx leptura TaxID=249018 RepID=UPI00339D28C5
MELEPAVRALSELPTTQNVCNKVILSTQCPAPSFRPSTLTRPRLGTAPRPPSSGGDPGAREPGPLGGASPFPRYSGRGCVKGAGPPAASPPPRPAPAPAPRPGGERVSGSHEPPARQPGSGPPPPPPSRCPPPPPAARPPGSSGHRRCAALRCLRPGLGRGPRRSRPPRPAPACRAPARAMGLWLPPPPAPPG